MSQQSSINPAQAYDQYLGPAIFIPWAGLLLEQAAPKPGERVLDLACGTGIVTRQVAPRVGESGRVLGVDFNPAMLAVARSHPAPSPAAPIEWREGNACALDTGDEAFDLLLCQQGFQFFPDKPAAARGTREALADGGRVVLSVWKGLDHHPVFAALFEAEARYLGVDVNKLAVPFSMSDADELRGLLAGGGLERIEIDTRTMESQFPDPERFVTLTVMAGAAVIPELASADQSAHDRLVEAVSRQAAPTIDRYRQGDRLAFPMTTHVAVAYR